MAASNGLARPKASTPLSDLFAQAFFPPAGDALGIVGPYRSMAEKPDPKGNAQKRKNKMHKKGKNHLGEHYDTPPSDH